MEASKCLDFILHPTKGCSDVYEPCDLFCRMSCDGVFIERRGGSQMLCCCDVQLIQGIFVKRRQWFNVFPPIVNQYSCLVFTRLLTAYLFQPNFSLPSAHRGFIALQTKGNRNQSSCGSTRCLWLEFLTTNIRNPIAAIHQRELA